MTILLRIVLGLLTLVAYSYACALFAYYILTFPPFKQFDVWDWIGIFAVGFLFTTLATLRTRLDDDLKDL